MELRIFTLPFDETSESFPDEIITDFCLNKKVHDIRTEFFRQEGRAFWSVALRFERVVKDKDHLRDLDETEKLLFGRLRDWRKETGDKEGIPVYLVATNSQLQQIIKLKCQTLESFKPVKGFGKKRIDKYGKRLIETMKAFYETRKQAAETPATPY